MHSGSRALILALLAGCNPLPPETNQDRSAQLVDQDGNNDGQLATLCKTITVTGRVDYNDQRTFGRFPIHQREDRTKGVQYRVNNDTGDADDHDLNYLGLYDATVELYEVDRVADNNYCSPSTYLARVTAGADGSYSWTGQVCDSCGNDDSIEGASSVSIAAKILLQYCPADHSRCFFVQKPPAWLGENEPRFDDHGAGASTYFRWATLANLTQPQIVRGSSIVLPTTHYENRANDHTDLDAQAAMVFASTVDVTRKVHVAAGIPFKFDEFGDVKVVFPMNYQDTGNGHSHESGRFCLPSWGRVVDDQTIIHPGEVLPLPSEWPDRPTPFHEYGHIVMYRALHGHGKWVNYHLDWDADGLSDSHEGDPLEHPAAATKEPWANFIAYATLNDVNGPTVPGIGLEAARATSNPETLDVLGCDNRPDWDDMVEGAEVACNEPDACPAGKKAPHAVVRSLCDWFDQRDDTPDGMWNQTSESFSSSLETIYRALEDSWMVVPQSVRDDYEHSDNDSVERGIHICDIAQAHVNSHSGDRVALGNLLKHNGIDCQLQ